MKFSAYALKVFLSSLVMLSVTGCGGGSSTPAPVASSSSGSPAASSSSSAAPPAAGAQSMAPPGASEPASGTPSDQPNTDNASGGTEPQTMFGNPGGSGPPAYAGDGYVQPGSEGGMPAMPGMGPTGESGFGPLGGGGLAGGLTGGMFNGLPMGAMGMGSNVPRSPDDPPAEEASYLEKANYAFAIGKEDVAVKYFIAHVITNDEDAASQLANVKWSKQLVAPVLFERFGIGVELEAPTNLTDYKPLGKNQFTQGGAQGGGMESGMMMGQPGAPGAPGAGGAAGKNLQDMTGKFGEQLVEKFKGSWDNGDFGTAFNMVQPIDPNRRRLGPGGMGPGGMGQPGGMGMSGPPGLAGAAMSGPPGAMGGLAPDGFVPPDQGMGMGNGGEGQPGAAPGAGTPAINMRPPVGKNVTAGLKYLGTGSSKDLVAKAQKEGLVALFFFEVKAERQRNGLVKNVTSLRLLGMDGKAMGSVSISNIDYEKDQIKGDDAGLEKGLGNIMKKLEQFRLNPMPSLDRAAALKRVPSLLAKVSDDPFPALLEIRLYNNLGLLTKEEASAAYQVALNGYAGEFLALGNAEERQTVLDPLLPSYK